MKSKIIGELVVRGLGVGFIILGASAASALIQILGNPNIVQYNPKGILIACVPWLIQLFSGAAMLIWSQPLGRLLARGLSDDADA